MAETLDDYDFSTAEAGAAHTYPMEAGQLRKGGYVMIKGHPCKVINTSVSKTGKHGHAKVNITALDIFTGKRYEDIVPSTHTTSVPNVSRNEYLLLDIDEEGALSLMEDNGDTKDDLNLPTFPENLAQEIRDGFDEGKQIMLGTLCAMGNEQIVTWKEEN